MKTETYVGLGGNVGDSVYYLNKALEEIEKIPGVEGVECSHFYRTTPVGPIDQDDFVNAVCRFKTSLSLKEIHHELLRIQSEMDGTSRLKNHPRVIDLDLLFFGQEICNESSLHVPHPHWNDRLFVLVPLSDLTEEIEIAGNAVNLPELIRNFPNRHDETITFLTEPQKALR